jgi:hypothetical protein
MIIYYPGTKNQKADALTRRESDIYVQNIIKKEVYQQVIISKSKINLTIRIELLIMDSMTLLNYIFDTNRINNQFDPFRERVYQANKSLYNFNLEGLLLYNNKLIVSAKIFNKKPLIIILIREIYA